MAQLSDRPTRLDEGEREIIEALYQPLRRYAGVVGSVDVDPEDLVQEAFLRTLRRGPLSDLDNPGAYLRRTIVNIASNERRRLGRLRGVLPRLAVDEESVDIALPDVSELLTLAPKARAVLFLSAVEGYSYKEIGGAVGCSETAARKIAARARRKLRTLMTTEEAGDANA